jgi:hypothetical protein
MPFVSPEAAYDLLSQLGDITREVGRMEGVDVLTGPAEVEWADSDFVTWLHFNAQGSRKFAQAIGPDIQRLCVN